MSEMFVIPDESRVIQRKVVFVSGIPSNIYNVKILTSTQWFGKYGNIELIHMDAGTAYIQYYRAIDAENAIKAMHIYQTLKVNYAVNRFCKHFLNGTNCSDTRCSFVHCNVDPKDIVFQKEIDEYFDDRQSKIDELKRENLKLKQRNLELIKSFEIHETQSIIDKMDNDSKLKQLETENERIKNKHFLLIQAYNKLQQKYNSDIVYKAECIELRKRLKSMLNVDLDQINHNNSDEL